MNGQGRYWMFQLAANVIVTLAFLAFAWLLRTQDHTIAPLVVGASLTHWFKESSSLGRTLNSVIDKPSKP